MATITWLNAFVDDGRVTYIPDETPWRVASRMLNDFWTARCSRPLAEDQLHYLACLALRRDQLSQVRVGACAETRTSYAECFNRYRKRKTRRF